MTPKFRTAFYPGSFNPFTIGHKSIVDRVLKICDRVVIAVGLNADKPHENALLNLERITQLYAGDERVKVTYYTGLTVEAARLEGADFIVRGIRGVNDYEYERNLAETNLHISGIETIFLRAPRTVDGVIEHGPRTRPLRLRRGPVHAKTCKLTQYIHRNYEKTTLYCTCPDCSRRPVRPASPDAATETRHDRGSDRPILC